MKADYKTSVPQADLAESATERQRLIQKWGFEPISMWWMQNVHNKTLDVIVEDSLAVGSYPEHNFSVRGGALPQTPTIASERFIKFYSEPGEMLGTPFAERLPHVLLGNYFGRNTYGQDLCKKFIDHDFAKVKRRVNDNRALDSDGNQILVDTEKQLKVLLNGLSLEIRYGDSRHIDLPDNSWDFCINSPPYYSTITYDAVEEGQIGTGKNSRGEKQTYEDFLNSLGDIYKECLRLVKPGRFMVIMLNDFRMDKKFYCYHGDTMHKLEEIGWTPWDIVVYNLSVHPLHAIFTTQLDRDKHSAKCHEYGLVVRKPQ